MRLRFVWLEVGCFVATIAFAQFGLEPVAVIALVSALGLHAYDFVLIHALLRRLTTSPSARAPE